MSDRLSRRGVKVSLDFSAVAKKRTRLDQRLGQIRYVLNYISTHPDDPRYHKALEHELPWRCANVNALWREGRHEDAMNELVELEDHCRVVEGVDRANEAYWRRQFKVDEANRARRDIAAKTLDLWQAKADQFFEEQPAAKMDAAWLYVRDALGLADQQRGTFMKKVRKGGRKKAEKSSDGL